MNTEIESIKTLTDTELKAVSPIRQLEGMVSLPPFFVDNDVILFNDKWERVLPLLPDSCVDMVLCDLPYGETKNEWDIKANLQELWKQYERLTNLVVLTAQQPFTTDLVESKRDWFKYDLIWEKNRPTGFLNVGKMPMRSHEHILVFYKELKTYNPQRWFGEKNHSKNGGVREIKVCNNYGGNKPYTQKSTNEKEPHSVLHHPQEDPGKSIHPTQKPVGLFSWLIKTYTNEGNIVLDNTCGSGTTLVAAKLTKRKAIGIEMGLDYCERSVNERLNRPIPLFQDSGRTS